MTLCNAENATLTVNAQNELLSAGLGDDMYKFWWSGEVQGDVRDAHREAMKSIARELNGLLEHFAFDGKAEQWAFIPIILKEEIATLIQKWLRNLLEEKYLSSD